MTADSEPAGSPIAPVRGSARGPSPGAVLLLVTVALAGAVAVAVATAPAPSPQPLPTAVALASPSAPASSSAGPATSPPGRPSASPLVAGAVTVVVLRGVADPAGALGTLAGCSPLLRFGGGALPAITGSDVDATATAAGRETGWIFVPPGIQALTRVWLGSDVVELAHAAGQPVVAVGTNGDVWLGGPAGAARWRPIPTPQGRTAWVLTADAVTSHGRCGPWRVPASLAGQRSVTCSGVGVTACLGLVARVESDTPGVPYPGGDIAMAGTACRAPSLACSKAELTAVAVPAAWAGTISGVRAATALASGVRFRLLAPGAAPEYALDAISSPSLPLPTRAVTVASRACATTLTGDLRAAAWDPRVFWVGTTAVVWPAGTSARFVNLPALTVPRADGSYRFVEGASVRLQGSADATTHAFVACRAGPLSRAAGASAVPGG